MSNMLAVLTFTGVAFCFMLFMTRDVAASAFVALATLFVLSLVALADWGSK
jgi:hypothetical protein